MPIIVELTATRTVQDWLDLLGAAGVPCGRIRTVAEVCTNPQLVERGKLVDRPHPTAETVRMIGMPIELSDTPGRIEVAPPLLGQHTDEILTEAGYSQEDLQLFHDGGIV